MRTTITLDPDVAMMLKKRMQEQDLSFKDTVNQTLRQGFKAAISKKKRTPYKVKTFSLEFRPGIDPNRLNQLVDQLEVEDFIRKVNK